MERGRGEAAFWTVAPSEEAKNYRFLSNKRKHFQGVHNMEAVLFHQKTRLYTRPSSHEAFCQPLTETLSQEKGKKTHGELQQASLLAPSSRSVQVQANQVRGNPQSLQIAFPSPYMQHPSRGSIFHDAAEWDRGQLGAQAKISGRKRTVRDDKKGIWTGWGMTCTLCLAKDLTTSTMSKDCG